MQAIKNMFIYYTPQIETMHNVCIWFQLTAFRTREKAIEKNAKNQWRIELWVWARGKEEIKHNFVSEPSHVICHLPYFIRRAAFVFIGDFLSLFLVGIIKMNLFGQQKNFQLSSHCKSQKIGIIFGNDKKYA